MHVFSFFDRLLKLNVWGSTGCIDFYFSFRSNKNEFRCKNMSWYTSINWINSSHRSMSGNYV